MYPTFPNTSHSYLFAELPQLIGCIGLSRV